MARSATAEVSLVNESRSVLSEIRAVRQGFVGGKICREQIETHIGLFNATSKAIGTVIKAEKWEAEKNGTRKSCRD